MNIWLNSVLNKDFIDNIFDANSKLYSKSSLLHFQFNSQQVEQYLISHEGELHKYVMIYDQTENYHVHANTKFSQKSQVDTIRERFQYDATLKIEQLERRQQEISAICCKLETFFGGTTFVKVFWTPANKKGLKVHFDPVSAFIIQLEGEKKWFLWDKLEHNPTQQMSKVLDEETIGSPREELLLKAGDVLYIPAGMPHRAECTDTSSLHITIGLSVCKVFDLLHFAVEQLSHKNAIFRHSITPDLPNCEFIKAQLDTAINQLNNVNAEQLIKSYTLAVNASRPNIHNPLLL
ncbi:JmjC domain-containing protein [Photorhabdus sp. SF281]|uniref:JmjC domain-containing protein n=1 Tax=Photorhabdus sp. SF281 TaxID=3459527 RepID=UPI004044C3F6